MGKRIIIMAGGTGGHVFPALAVARLLREQGWQVSWMGTSQGMESKVATANNFEMDQLAVVGLRGKGLKAKLQAPVMLLCACLQAWKILRNRKPDVVLGMGGFVAGPGGLMASLTGIPLVIHEQNRVPGTTNRLLAGRANKVLEAFPGSFKMKQHAYWTGNPLRKEFIAMQKQQLAKQKDELNILVVGGSLGAQALNEIVPDALKKIASVRVKHQTGTAMLEIVTEQYQKLGIEAEAVAFIDDIAAAYAWADLVICRAGAMTISELAIAGLPAVLIPFPYAIDDHQTANANFLVEAGAGILLDQKRLTVAELVKQIGHILSNRLSMAAAAKSCAKPDATERVASFCAEQVGL